MTIRAPSIVDGVRLQLSPSQLQRFRKSQAAKCFLHAIDRGMASTASKRQIETIRVSPSRVSLCPSRDLSEQENSLENKVSSG